MKDHGVSESEDKAELKDLSLVLIENYKARPIVILMDEIIRPNNMLYSLAEPIESFPAKVTIIAVVNPKNSSLLPTLPESVLQINLTTPYRSTIAITSLSLARFLAKSYFHLKVPEGEFGSDVEETKTETSETSDQTRTC